MRLDWNLLCALLRIRFSGSLQLILVTKLAVFQPQLVKTNPLYNQHICFFQKGILLSSGVSGSLLVRKLITVTRSDQTTLNQIYFANRRHYSTNTTDLFTTQHRTFETGWYYHLLFETEPVHMIWKKQDGLKPRLNRWAKTNRGLQSHGCNGLYGWYISPVSLMSSFVDLIQFPWKWKYECSRLNYL